MTLARLYLDEENWAKAIEVRPTWSSASPARWTRLSCSRRPTKARAR